LAWFGVNLLGVGLHSYGFTSGIAQALFIFIAFELLFVVVTLLFLKSGEGRGQVLRAKNASPNDAAPSPVNE
jgi:hypothetical protein